VKPIVRRRRTTQDIAEAYEHYLEEGGATQAGQFLSAVGACMEHIAQHPGTGSPRYAGFAPGLRHWQLNRFPFTAFYIDREDHIDLLRVLHQASDIPAHLKN
jgi:toxin ParE1/3/4